MSKTYGEQFDSAMKCQTVGKAKKWLDSEIRYAVNMYGQTPEEAKRVILTNLAYMAGYYDHETAQKVNRLFGPIFGGADYHETVTPEQAFDAGVKAAGGVKLGPVK